MKAVKMQTAVMISAVVQFPIKILIVMERYSVMVRFQKVLTSKVSELYKTRNGLIWGKAIKMKH